MATTENRPPVPPERRRPRERERHDRRRGSGGWWGWMVLAVVIVAAVGGGIYLWKTNRAEASETRQGNRNSDPGDRNQAVSRVEVIQPHQGGITRATTQPGVLHSFEEADLRAKASGYLRAQVVDIGDVVERGQVLAEIYDPERNEEVEAAAAAVEAARARRAQAEAELEAAKAEVLASTAEVHERQAEVGRYTATRKYREKEYLRYQELAKSRVVDERVVDEQQENFESAQANEQVALAAVETARGRLAKAEAGVATARANIQTAEADVRVAEARQSRAVILADYLRILSPYDGIVTRRNFHRGAFIAEASNGGESPPILSVARTDLMRVVLYVPDRDVPLVDRGDPAVVRLDALPGEEFKAEVSRFSNIEMSSNRTMRVEVDLPNPVGRLRDGMYGLVTIKLNQAPDSLTVPSAALVQADEHGKGKLFVARDGQARELDVRVGRDDGLRAEILEGLSPHDQVIATPVSLEDGDQVHPVPLGGS